ncbi:MAG: GNAT family N-acetyltransferase [Lachnospiraceae bacterium]|nr:GNAT family N-acetyltransferase [Lachnospiraceae bacterium]
MNRDMVYLRPMTAADTAKIVTWRNKDFVRQNFIYQKPFTKEGHMAWFREQVEPGRVVQFIICVRDEDAGRCNDGKTCEKDWEIGSVYLRDIDRKGKTAEYGVFIGEEKALGRGYGTAAAKLALVYGFETLRLQKIFLRFLEDNGGARKSYERAGFRMVEGRRESVVLEQGVREVLFMEIGCAEWEMTRGLEKI